MEKITSFTINHLKLEPGVYVSRVDHYGDTAITTFDLRMTAPNREPVMNTAEVNMQKYGVRITGMTNASNSFVGKIGSGLGGSAIGWILAAGGYDAYAATGEATGKVIGAVNVLNVYIPIAIFVVMALILFRYDLEEKLPEIRRENDRRMADHPAEN